MTNEELIDKIKAEIERQKKENINYDENGDFASYCDFSAWSALDSVLTFISDLEKSQMPRKLLEKMELEKEIEDAWEKIEKDYSPSALDKTTILVSGLVGEKQFSKIAHHFAEWQKEKDEVSKVNYEGARAVYDNTVQHLQEKINEKYELGKKDMREQMLKDAVEGEVMLNPYPTICLDDCKDYDFNEGDKVRVIIIPKED